MVDGAAPARGYETAADQAAPSVETSAKVRRLDWDTEDLLRAVRSYGERAAILSVEDERTEATSGEDLMRLIRGAAQQMTADGVGPGDIVAIWAANAPAWIAVGLASAALGAVFAPIDAMVGAEEALPQIEATGARVVFSDREKPSTAEGSPPWVLLSAIPSIEGSLPVTRVAPSAPMVLFRTSGTTGEPKIFTLSHRNIGWNVGTVAGAGLVEARDQVLLPLPMHHVYPWITATLSAIAVGATLILPESASGPHIATALRVSRPTVIIGVPRLYEAMLEGIRSKVRRSGWLAAGVFDALMGAAIRLNRSGGSGGAGWIARTLTAPVRRSFAPDLRLLVSASP
ncbi:MAG: AMP-binding protein [Pseudomonadota bacterium]